MKKTLLFFFFLLIVILQSLSQTSYDIVLATNYDDKISFVYHDMINNEQILLYTLDCPSDDTNCISRRKIYRINSYGDTLILPFDEVRNDTLYEIEHLIKESDGNYFMTGVAWVTDTNNGWKYEYDYFLKWDENYNTLWESVYARPDKLDTLSISQNYKILKLVNGNYLVGRTVITRYIGYKRWYYLTEIDKTNGCMVKNKIQDYFGGLLQGLTYNHDTSKILVHMSRNWLNECKRNSCGVYTIDTLSYDTLSSFCYNRDDDDPYKHWCVHVPYNAKIGADGNLILSGTGDCSNLYGGQEDYLFVYEYDTSFNLINRAFYTDPDTLYDAGWFESMDFNDTGEILIAGNHNRHVGPYSGIYSYIYLAKLDEDLQLISERYIGCDAEYVVHSMDATEDGGMVVSGTRYDYMVNDSEHDAFIFKTDANLWVDIPENSTMEIHSAIVYPNPGENAINLRTTEYPSTFQLFNVQGQVVTTQSIQNRISKINTSSLPKGIYFWVLHNDNKILDHGKWVKN